MIGEWQDKLEKARYKCRTIGFRLAARAGELRDVSADPEVPELSQQMYDVAEQAHALAELADQWLRSDREPTAGELRGFAARARRVGEATRTLANKIDELS